jgi:hypothetical protein
MPGLDPLKALQPAWTCVGSAKSAISSTGQPTEVRDLLLLKFVKFIVVPLLH